MRAPLVGISRPFGASVPKESTSPENPTSRVTFRVQGFSPSSRLTPLSASRVYFTPQTPFGFALQGFVPLEERRQLFADVCRRAVIPRLRSRHLEWQDQRRTNLPLLESGAGAFGRLHGFAPLESPYRSRDGFSILRRPSPSWVFPLQGFPLPGDAPAHHRRSFRVLGPVFALPGCPKSPNTAALRSLCRQVVALPLSRPPSPPEVSGHLFLTMQQR